MICLLSALNGPFLPACVKGAQRGALRGTRPFSSHTALVEQYYQLGNGGGVAFCVVPRLDIAGIKHRDGERGSLIVPFLVHYSPPSLHQTKVCTATESERPGGGASTVQTLCRLYAQTTWGKLVFGTWQTQNITFCCCSAHYPTSSCLSPPSSAFPNTHHPDTHAHTHTCAHSRKQRTSKSVIA